MITAESVEQAVIQLSPEEFAKFRSWLTEFEANARKYGASPKTPGSLAEEEFEIYADELADELDKYRVSFTPPSDYAISRAGIYDEIKFRKSP